MFFFKKNKTNRKEASELFDYCCYITRIENIIELLENAKHTITPGQNDPEAMKKLRMSACDSAAECIELLKQGSKVLYVLLPPRDKGRAEKFRKSLEDSTKELEELCISAAFDYLSIKKNILPCCRALLELINNAQNPSL